MTPIGLHNRIKRWIAHSLALDDATLHVHLGLAIYLAAVLALGGELASPWPLAIVAAVQAGNELFDRLRTGSWRWRDTAADFVNTLLWPAVLTAGGYIFG